MPSTASSRHTQTTARRSTPWFGIGMAGIFLLSLILRFWGLGRFNTLVFDEVYYAKFASAFIKDETVFTGHPPLSTYIIAIGIWIGRLLPWGNSDPKNELAGLLLSPFSYRWLNAFTGSFIPLVVGAIAFQLLRRRSFALIAALLIALDGLFLVESRYALNNVYLILFGLLGQLWFLLALRHQGGKRWLYLLLSGIGFGAAAAIKWNGLGFLLGAYGVWAAAWLVQWIQIGWASWNLKNREARPDRKLPQSILRNLTQLQFGHVFLALAVVPALTYYVSWLPYMQVDPSDSNFWQLQAQTYDYHKRVGGIEAHPYCSRWYTWPLMLRPVAYFYETMQVGTTSATIGSALPNQTKTLIYDVHAMGNPILWWLSSAAVVLFALLLAQQCWQWLNPYRPAARLSTAPLYQWTVAYLLINWAANFLPWVRVTRCLFLYHYMPSLVFAVLLLALLVDRWLQSALAWQRIAAVATLLVVLLGFIFWLPLFLGLPLTPESLAMRRWFSSWI